MRTIADIAADYHSADPATQRGAIIEFADFCRDTCLFYGSEMKTAYNVAAVVASDLEKEGERDEHRPGILD